MAKKNDGRFPKCSCSIGDHLICGWLVYSFDAPTEMAGGWGTNAGNDQLRMFSKLWMWKSWVCFLRYMNWKPHVKDLPQQDYWTVSKLLDIYLQTKTLCGATNVIMRYVCCSILIGLDSPDIIFPIVPVFSVALLHRMCGRYLSRYVLDTASLF